MATILIYLFIPFIVTSYLFCFCCLIASFTALFEPSATVSLESYTATKDYLVLETLDTVKSRFVFWRFDEAPTSDGRAAVEAKGDCADETGVTGVWVHCGAEPGKCAECDFLMDAFNTTFFILPMNFTHIAVDVPSGQYQGFVADSS